MNASTQVFNIPELMELILLFLPCDTIHAEIASMCTIHVSQSTSRTWHSLLHESTPLRQRLYLPTVLDKSGSQTWLERTVFPPAEPNPWIPHILLNQRSWGSAWPFETSYTMYEGLVSSRPKYWTFALELSRAQYSRLPPPGAWRDQLATTPPFTDFWYTRAFYELGSGRAPFVTHVDYNAKVPKSQQKYRRHCPDGVTLGHIVDAMTDLFEKHSAAKFVMVESVRCIPTKEVLEDSKMESYVPGASATSAADQSLRQLASKEPSEEADERPRTRLHMPGLSAERTQGWQRGQ